MSLIYSVHVWPQPKCVRDIFSFNGLMYWGSGAVEAFLPTGIMPVVSMICMYFSCFLFMYRVLGGLLIQMHRAVRSWLSVHSFVVFSFFFLFTSVEHLRTKARVETTFYVVDIFL